MMPSERPRIGRARPGAGSILRPEPAMRRGSLTKRQGPGRASSSGRGAPARLVALAGLVAILVALSQFVAKEDGLGHPIDAWLSAVVEATGLGRAQETGDATLREPGRQADASRSFPRECPQPGDSPLQGGSSAVLDDQNPAPSSFLMQDAKLYVCTRQMILRIEGGAVTYAQDRASGQVLVDAEAYANRPVEPVGFVGFGSKGADAGRHVRRPEASSPVSCSWMEANRVRLTYGDLYSGGTPTGGHLILDLTVDDASGEVVIQATGIEAEPTLRPYTVDVPIMSATTPAAILSSGAKYVREDAEAVDQTTYPDLGLNSPNMAIMEGTNAVLAVWSETTHFAPEYIRLEHTAAYDHLILHTEQDPKQTAPEVIVSSPWRIGTFPTWVQAAKRWRERFEERTGARPLWENRAPWVRNVHAVFDGTSQDYGADKAKYAELAGIADPEKVLYLLWNGDRLVLFGDHTLVRRIGRPTPELLAIVEQYGWPLLLYHPYTLIYSEEGTASRLEYLADNGWLPSGYQFTPDYDGRPEEWHDHWADARIDYSDGTGYYLLHPGATKFEDYLVRNLGGYCTAYQADGAYLDLRGDDNRGLFLDGALPVVEGRDTATGEVAALTRITEELPRLGLMSEYQGQWVLPYIFYTWEGSETHIRQNAHAKSRINHPLRTALVGSYAWTRESNGAYVDDAVAALLGTLPAVSLVGDHNVDDERARWSQARAKLFCDEELFNDLPDAWDDDALAYYRSKNGHWWKLVARGPTYAYVEILPNGEEIVRLAY